MGGASPPATYPANTWCDKMLGLGRATMLVLPYTVAILYEWAKSRHVRGHASISSRIFQSVDIGVCLDVYMDPHCDFGAAK